MAASAGQLCCRPLTDDDQTRGPSRWLLIGVVVAAALLQLSRLPFRWSPISIAYASYFKEFRHAVRVEGWDAAFTTFVGLHPPAYSLIFLGLMTLGVAPLVWHLLSALFSVAAVPAIWATLRRGSGPGAGLAVAAAAGVLAVSPHRNAYGLEVNNYPLLVLATSLQLLAFTAWLRRLDADPPGRRPSMTDLALMLATVLALYTHVLSITLPAAQLTSLLLTTRGRRLLVRFGAVQAVAALPCLPLLPAILSGGSAPPINAAPGLVGAAESVLVGFPTRYGSTVGTLLVGAVALLGGWRILRSARTGSLAPLSWLVHGVLTLAVIGAMVTTGVAADHQFPYYLAAIPSGALVAGSALTVGAGSPLPRRLATGALALGLILHVGVAGLDYHGARTVLARAPIERGLVGLAIQECSPGCALILIGFPSYSDDDKDVLDPAWSLIPISWRVRFEHPGVDELVTADPYWGQPVLMGGRWLYTFTGVDADRIDRIARHHLGQGHRVLLALYDVEGSHGELIEAEDWAARMGRPGRRAPGQVLWTLDPR